jgi:hypothetical protein
MIRKSHHTILCLFASLALLLFGGCHDSFNKCLTGPGSVKTERMGLYAFGNVRVQDNIDLTLVNGNDYELEITTGENLIPMLGINIINNTLHLSNESTCALLKDPWKRIAMKLTLPTLDTLFIESFGDINCLGDFMADSLVVQVIESPSNIKLSVDCNFLNFGNLSGTADITIEGRTLRFNCFHAGYGKLNFSGLHADYVYFNTQSTNNCFVRGGNRYFYAVMAGIGNAYYFNDPEKIDLLIKNTGQLIRVYE